MIIVRIGLGITTLTGSSTAGTGTSTVSKAHHSQGRQDTFQRVRLRFNHTVSATESEADDSVALETAPSRDELALKTLEGEVCDLPVLMISFTSLI